MPIFPATKPDQEEGSRQVFLVVARDCNLSCRYCSQSHRSPARMTSAMARTCLGRELAEAKGSGSTIMVEFFGGEPFLNFPLIREIVEWGVAEGLPFTFRAQTNGTVIDRGIRRWLEKNRERISVGLSLDGFSEMNAANRGSRDVDVGFFRELWPEMRVSAFVVPESVRCLSKSVSEFVGSRIPFQLAPADGLTWTEDAAKKLMGQLLECADLPGFGYEEGVASGLWPFDPADLFPTEDSAKLHFCGDKKSTVLYDTDGTDYFCQMFSPSALGDGRAKVLRESLKAAVWVDSDKMCRACGLRRFCRPCFGWRCKIGTGICDPVEKRTACLAVKAFACASAWRFLEEMDAIRQKTGEMDDSDIYRGRMAVRLLSEIRELWE